MSVRSAGGRGRARAEQKRLEIVGYAADLFNRVGYHTTSVEDIANAANIRKPTLYHYFDSKEEILFWIHESFIDLLIARKTARETLNLSPAQHVREIIEDILGLMETHRGHVRVFFEHYRELGTERQATIKKKRDMYEDYIKQVIQQGVDEGSFRPLDVQLTTLALAGMCDWAYQWYRPTGPRSTREIALVFCDLLMNGLQKS